MTESNDNGTTRALLTRLYFGRKSDQHKAHTWYSDTSGISCSGRESNLGFMDLTTCTLTTELLVWDNISALDLTWHLRFTDVIQARHFRIDNVLRYCNMSWNIGDRETWQPICEGIVDMAVFWHFDHWATDLFCYFLLFTLQQSVFAWCM